MANEIRYQVGFDVKQGDLNKLKASLQDLQKMKISDIMKINDVDTSSATNMLIAIKTQAKNVEDALKNAFNAKLNTVNIESFNKSLKDSHTSVQQIYKAFRSAGTTGENAFRSLSSQVLSTNIQLKETHGLLDKMATTLANTVKWNIASGAVNNMSRAIEQAWGYTKSLDTSLNNIRIVTGKSAEEMGNFAIKANEAAQSLGKTTTDYTNAALIYAQQGLSDKEIEERARITLMTANVTGQSTSDVSEELTAVWNGYKVSAEEAEVYIDRLAAVAATTASDLEELSTGMSKVASAAAAMGVGEDQLAAQLSTIISVTRQAPESVGTALRTVYARISDIKAGIDEDGVTLGNYSGKMAELGFNVLDAAGNLRDMGEVMQEIGNRWQDLTREQQISLAQTMAGQRQYSNLIALFDNFEKYNEALNTARNAAGTLQEQQDIYMESTTAHLQTLKAAVENIYDSLTDTDSINGIVDGLTVAANVTANLVDSLGGGIGVLKALGSVGITVFSEQIAKGINTTITNLEIGRDNARQFDLALQATKDWQGIPGLDKTNQDLLKNREQLLELARLMTPEQFSGMQTLLNDITQVGNEIAQLEDEQSFLNKAIEDVLKYSDAWQTAEEVMASDEGQTEVIKRLQQQEQGIQNVVKAINQYSKLQNTINTKMINGEAISSELEQAKQSVTNYYNELEKLGSSGQLSERHIQSLENIKKELDTLDDAIDEPAMTAKIQLIIGELRGIATAAGKSAVETRQKIESEMGAAADSIVNKIIERQTQLQNMVTQFVTGQERMQRAANIENYAKMAGGIAQVGSAIQQVQNLGSIWANSDLSTGQKLLQTITNLAISLPMLATGFTKATTALGLMEIVQNKEAIAAIKATTAEITHAGAISLVETSSGKAAIKVQLLNKTLMLNPYVAATVLIMALVTALGALANAFDKANEKAIQSAQTSIDTANSKQQQIEKNKELYNSLEELNEKYEEGQITRAELKTQIESLIKTYGLQGQAADKLQKQYDNLKQSILESRKQAAKLAKISATDELKNARESLVRGAKGKIGDSGTEIGDKFVLNISGGENVFDEQSRIFRAYMQAGGMLTGNRFTFVTDNDAESILDLYKKLEQANKYLKDHADEVKLNNSEFYTGTEKWLSQIDKYAKQVESALKDIEKYSTELLAYSQVFDFNDVKDAADYTQKRMLLIDKVMKELNKDSEQAEAITDAFLKQNYAKDFFNYNEISKFLNTFETQFKKDHLLSLDNEEIQKQLSNIINSLNSNQFSTLMKLNPQVINSWDELRNIIQIIASIDLSQVANQVRIDQAATQRYNKYAELETQVNSGKSISKSAYESLDESAQQYFRKMINGTYKMTGNAEQFERTVNHLKFDGLIKNIESLNRANNSISNYIKNPQEINRLQTSSAYNAQTGTTDRVLASEQLNLLASSGYDLAQIAAWEAQIVAQGEPAKETIDAIYQALSDQTNIAERIKQQFIQNTQFLQEQEQTLASSAKSIQELREYLNNGLISKEVYTSAALDLQQQLSLQGIDLDKLKEYSDYLQEIAEQNEYLDDALQHQDEAANKVAKSITKLNNGIQSLSKNWKSWGDILKNSSQESDQYKDALDKTKDALSEMFDISSDYISNQFVADHLKEIQDAANGSEEAISQLQSSLLDEIIIKIALENDIEQSDIQELVAGLQENVPELKVGAVLQNGDFINQAQELINKCHLTADQANDIFKGIGFSPTFKTIKEPIQKSFTQTETRTTLDFEPQTVDMPILGSMTFPLPILKSVTTPGDTSYVTQWVDVPALDGNGNPQIKELTAIGAGSGGLGGFSNNSKRNSGGGSGKKGGGGGGGGKGSKPDTSQKETKEALKDQIDLYHDINIQIGDLNRKLDNTQKKQSRLYGKDLINNLNEQNDILDQQIGKLEQKYQLQKQDKAQKQTQLQELGVVFDSYGKIGNYMDLLQEKQNAINDLIKQYNLLIQQYNQTTEEERKKELNQQISELDKKIQHETQKMNNLKKGMDEYDKLMDEMQNNEDQREAKRQQQFENNIQKFRTDIEIRLDMGEAEKDWNNFRRNVLNHSNILKDSEFDRMLKDVEQNYQDILSYFDINGQMGTLQALTDQINATQDELDEINNGGESSIYGDNKKQAMQDLQSDLNELMQQMEDIESLIDNIDQAYLDTIDDIMDQFDKQIEDYALIGELIEHDVDLLSLLYGDRNYDAMDKYYTTLQNNNLKQLDSLRQQRDFWKQQWDEAVAREDNEAAKKFEENYKETINNLNSLIEESAENLKNKYMNAIDDIFNELDKKLSGGIGTDYLSLEWDLLNKNADEYLDTINAAFAVQELEDKFRKALNDTNNLKTQQALKNLMDQQLNNLRAKEKLTEYDIERAEKLLQIEQARIALEDAQASKTSMRLKRDSQGNYSYEYVADQGNIADAQQNLANAQNDLYNFDKDRYQSNLGDMLSAWKDFQEEYKQIVTDVSLTEEERVAKTALLREQYGQYINDKTAENMVIRTNLMESAFIDIAAIYQTDVGNYQQMADDEKNILMSDLVPAWESGIQQMADKVAGEGGFIPVCEEAFENITEATEDYKDELDEMARVAGVDLNDVKQGVDDLAISFADLVEKNDDLLDRMDKEMDAISDLKDAAHELKKEYDNVYEAAKRAVSAAHDSLQDTRADQWNDDDDDDWEDSDDDYLDDGAVVNDIGPGVGLTNNQTYDKPYSIEGTWTSVKDDDGSYSIYRMDADKTQKIASNQSAGNVEDAMAILKYDYRNRYGHYDTGGYTGNWSGNQGIPAILHKKELVLNATDTQNMLNSVEILRGITSSLGGNLFNRLSDISSYSQMKNMFASDAVEQNVHIDASFPNVDSKREIEEALSDLVNLAAQRAMRNR